MKFISLEDNEQDIAAMSRLASAIVKAHYDPIIGPEQNDYMIKKFQSEAAIKEQLEDGYRYYFVREDSDDIGFISIRPEGNEMYLSKFYLRADMRGRGYARLMLDFIIGETGKEGLKVIRLNVNKRNGTVDIYDHLGFIREEAVKKDIGNGFYMDDYIFRYYL